MHASKYNLVFDIEGRKEKLVLNPLSRAMDILDGEDTSLLGLLQGNGNSPSEDPDGVDYMLERGYLFHSPEEESRFLQELVEKDEREQFPGDLLLYPTMNCNLRCTYCFQKENDRRAKFDLISEELVNRAIENLRLSAPEGERPSRPLLYLFGGEPLLPGKRNRTIVEHILSSADRKDFRVGIITNGSNLASYADILKRYRTEFVQVTLDGPKDLHDRRRVYAGGKGSFDDIQRGIASLLNSEVKIYIRVNLDSQNIDSLPELSEFAVQAGWNTDHVVLFAGPYRDLVCTSYEYQLPEHVMLKKMFSFYEEKPQTRIIKLLAWPGVDYVVSFLRTGRLPPPRLSYCISSYGRYGVDAQGNVYACGTAVGKPEYAIGTLHPKLEIDPEKARVWRRRRFTDIPRCRDCALAPLCGGGCTLQSLLKHEGKQPFCPEIRENLQVALNYYFDEIAKGGADVH